MLKCNKLPRPVPWRPGGSVLRRAPYRTICQASSASPPGSRTPAGREASSPNKGPSCVEQQRGNNILPRPQQQPGTASGGDAFQWREQWYPLMPASYVDRRRPQAITVLGYPLVVWYYAPSASWQCFEDRCPHRLAPLSEGRVDPSTGSLACSYHGWQLGAGGRCTAIPQADSPEQAAAALDSPRACAASYPVREEQGLLWVWLEPGADAALRSLARPVALPSELQNGTGLLLGDWYMRDLPVSYAYLLENLLDPAHVFFAHHGVIGQRDRGGPIRLEQQGELSAQGGFAVRMEKTGMAGGLPALTRFVPPSLAWLSLGPNSGRGGGAEGFSFSMLFYAVPVAPGRSRIFAGYSTSAAPAILRRVLDSGALAPLLHSLQWLGDLGAHEVIDGDTLFLRYQEERAAATGGAGRGPPYFMPTNSDRAVALLRRWLEQHAGGGPEYGPAAGPPDQTLAPLTREQILDRFEQHTKTCPHCSRALRGIRTLRGGLPIASASSLGAGLALAALQALLLQPPPLPAPGLPLGFGPRASAPLLFLAGGLVLAALDRALGQLERRFLFTDYTHWDK